MKFVRKIMAAVAVAALAVSLAACSSEDTFNIGIKYDQPGLGMKEGADYTGFDVAVARYVAQGLGYSEDQIRFIESPSANRENMIEAGQVDLIFATYSITDSRKERVSFAGPYLIAGQDLLVRTEDTDIVGPESLSAGRKLCSVTGSTPAQRVKDEYAQDVELQEYTSYSQCVEALLSGNVDAVTTDDIILAGYAALPQNEGKLKVVGQPFSEERYGVGLKKGDVELCTKVNELLQAMIDDGSWEKALQDNVGASGYRPSEGNPPELDACA